MAVRSPGRHNQAVGEGALVLEVDEDDVLGLVIVKLGQNELVEGPGRKLLRVGRGVAAQRTAP